MKMKKIKKSDVLLKLTNIRFIALSDICCVNRGILYSLNRGSGLNYSVSTLEILAIRLYFSLQI